MLASISSLAIRMDCFIFVIDLKEFFLNEGTHALGNLTLNASTSKVESIKRDLDLLLHNGFNESDAINLMKKEFGNLHEKTKKELKVRDGEEIPYRFIRSPIYGTRCTTVFSTEPTGEVRISEKTYLAEGVEEKRYVFLSI